MEQTLLKNLLRNEPFTRKVIPYLKSEYFQNRNENLIFQVIQDYIQKYNLLPTTEAILISLTNKDNLFEAEYKESVSLLEEIASDKEESQDDWLLENTEKWCQEKALENALHQSIEIFDDKSGNKNARSKGAIPQILTEALAVSFDPNVGHDYLQDYDDRFEFYHRKLKTIPFDLEMLNRIYGGGLAAKTLTVIKIGRAHV